MGKTFVILCCMFSLGIAWTFIFRLPEAPPKRERIGKIGEGAIVRKEKKKAANEEVAEPEAEPPNAVFYAEKSAWGMVTFTHTEHS